MKIFYIALLAIILMSVAEAEVLNGPDKVIFLEFSLSKDDHVENASYHVDYGIPMIFPGRETNYIIKVIGRDAKTINQSYFYPSFQLADAAPTADGIQYLDSVSLFMRIPYHPDALTIEIVHGANTIYSIDLKALCDRNDICDKSENYLSCPQDCKEGTGIGYCDMKKDGVCNKNCPPEWDPDCKKNPEAVKQPGPEEFLPYAAGFVILVLLIAFILLRRKREAADIEKKRLDFERWKAEQERLKGSTSKP